MNAASGVLSPVLSPLSTLSLGQSPQSLGLRTKGTRGLGQRTKGPPKGLSKGHDVPRR